MNRSGRIEIKKNRLPLYNGDQNDTCFQISFLRPKTSIDQIKPTRVKFSTAKVSLFLILSLLVSLSGYQFLKSGEYIGELRVSPVRPIDHQGRIALIDQVLGFEVRFNENRSSLKISSKRSASATRFLKQTQIGYLEALDRDIRIQLEESTLIEKDIALTVLSLQNAEHLIAADRKSTTTSKLKKTKDFFESYLRRKEHQLISTQNEIKTLQELKSKVFISPLKRKDVGAKKFTKIALGLGLALAFLFVFIFRITVRHEPT